MTLKEQVTYIVDEYEAPVAIAKEIVSDMRHFDGLRKNASREEIDKWFVEYAHRLTAPLNKKLLKLMKKKR